MAAAGTVALFLTLVLRFWHPVYGFTRFLQMDAASADNSIKELHGLPLYVYRDRGNYDGIWYCQIAYHPLLDDSEFNSVIDNLGYRARRILLPALAWTLAAGREPWIFQVYSALNIGVWLAMAGLFWRILSVDSARSFAVWTGFLFSVGTMECVRHAMTDLLATALIAAALMAFEAGRGATGWLGAAGLTKETSLLSLPAVFTRPMLSGSNLRKTLIAALPLFLWLAYVRWRTGPGNPGLSNFTVPPFGYLQKWHDSISAFQTERDTLLVAVSLLAVFGLTVQAVYIALQPSRSDPWWRLGAVHALLMMFLGGLVWKDFPGAAPRVLLPMALAFNVLARRRNAAWVWILAGNLTVFAGLNCMRAVDRNDPREFASTRSGSVAALVRLEDGWFGLEHKSRHLWSWSGGTARVQFETWPKSRCMLRFSFVVHSLVPQTVHVRQEAVELWQGSVGSADTRATLDFPVKDGQALLVFSSDGPAVPESADRGARSLAFRIFDPEIEIVGRY
ncbi:MAG: hypothetical protein WCA95_15940 [Opitutaceae bacterium]